MAKTRSAERLALAQNQQKKLAKRTKKLKKGIENGSIVIKNPYRENNLGAKQKRGLIYVGHIPHGFYEDAMRDYFKQFGKVTNVKVCRSRISGNSKGFGYVEFAQPEVARIAADTMNNYIMFKKRIVTEFVPYENRPKDLFSERSGTTQSTSGKRNRNKQNPLQNRRKNTLKKLSSKKRITQELGIQCNVKSVEKEGKDFQGVKEEQPRQTSYIEPDDSDSNDDTFKKPRSKQIGSKILSANSQKALENSLTILKSNRSLLTKSLDSVNTLMSNNSLTKSQDEETQTPPLKIPKTEARKKKLKYKQKEKTDTKLMKINQEAIKQIARDLIRKRGSPRINVILTKPKSFTKKK